MGESLTQQHRVSDEASWCVKLCQRGRILTVPSKEASANYVPAAAVRRRMQALSGIIGRKEFVGGMSSLVLNPGAQPLIGIGY
jgi:hypothetical protein